MRKSVGESSYSVVVMVKTQEISFRVHRKQNYKQKHSKFLL